MKEFAFMMSFVGFTIMIISDMTMAIIIASSSGKTCHHCLSEGKYDDPSDQCVIRYHPKVSESPQWICLPKDATALQVN